MTATTCPVCDSQQTGTFLRRTRVPVHQNLVVEDRESACSVNRGELAMMVCEACGFVFNGAFDPDKLSYCAEYDNTQSCSAYFDTYLDALAKDMVEQQGVKNCLIVEVGCGKGHFLYKLVDYPGSGNRGIGFDPSYVGPDTLLEGRLQFRTCYYDDACSDVSAGVVVCRHVIEHIQSPLALLSAIRSALGQSSHARIFLETPCVEWILRNRVVWDFFYEHCSLFSANSLRLACQRSGFEVERIEHIFGNQYIWLEARAALPSLPAMVLEEARHTATLAWAYAAEEQALCRIRTAKLEALAALGKVALWGAGAKGATFANLLDPTCSLIDCVVDLNPNKQGRYIPGTGHPIIAPDGLRQRNIKSAVLMNPNYREENLQLLAKANIIVDLIDWSEHQ